jgi:hypothetical protein
MSNVCNGILRCFIIPLCLAASAFQVCGAEVLIEDFPAPESKNWIFGNGSEFPGAQGSFEVSQADKPNSLKADYCGKLKFDFSNGGAYVAALTRIDPLLLQQADGESFSALQLNLYRPEGTRVKIRLTDSSDQTFQKEIRSVPDEWSKVSTTLDLWESSSSGR